MKVILLENLKKIGTIGEIISVKRGFARNYLIANRKALYASKDNIKQVEKIKSELTKKDQEKKKLAKQILEKINNKIFGVKKLVTENKDLYGSIKPKEISNIIKEKSKAEVKKYPSKKNNFVNDDWSTFGSLFVIELNKDKK